MTEEWRDRYSRLRAERRAAGRCDRCNEPARPGMTQCVQHAKANSARTLANYYRRKAKADGRA